MDRSQHGLIELPAQERHGLIWMVDRAGAPIDVAAWLGPEMDEILAGYRLGELTAFRSEGFDEPANWKLMQDAFVDNYHIQYAHPNTAGKHIHTNVQTVEDFGRHARMVSPRKAIDRWLEEDPGDTDLGPYVTEGHFLLPNSTLLRQPDDHFELLTFRPHPADPGRCRMEMRLLVPPLEASGMDAGALQRVWEKNWADPAGRAAPRGLPAAAQLAGGSGQRRRGRDAAGPQRDGQPDLPPGAGQRCSRREARHDRTRHRRTVLLGPAGTGPPGHRLRRHGPG